MRTTTSNSTPFEVEPRVSRRQVRTRTSHSVAACTLLTIFVGVGAVGCAGVTNADTPAPSSPTSQANPSAAEDAREANDVIALGDSALTPRRSRMTVFSFEPVGRSVTPPPGAGWYAADIEFCVASNVKSVVPIERIRDEFGVRTESDELRRPDSAFGAPTEVYAEPGRTVVADECVRGLVAFPVMTEDPARYVGLFVQWGQLRWAVDEPDE